MNDKLEKVISNAETHYDGHFTLMKFTTNWRACYGTVSERFEIEQMRVGTTMEEALQALLISPIDIYQMKRDKF